MQPRLARGMQQAVVRQTAHACEASCPRSRGRQRALATKEISPSSREEVGQGLHTRMQPPLPTRGASSAGSRGKLPAIAGQAARARHQATHGTLAGHAQHSRLGKIFCPDAEHGDGRRTELMPVIFCPGLFVPVGTSLAGRGREAAMPLSALLPLFHGGRMLQLASVMRETTTCEKRSEGLDFLRGRRIIFLPLENSFKNRPKWRNRDTKKLGSSKRHRNGLKF
ncbi:hypothetical protein AB3S75_042548 [Citrus x aurantiifolia]